MITRRAAYRRLIDDFLDLFGGSARPLMAHLLETGKLTLEDVRTLETTLAKTQGRGLLSHDGKQEDR